MKSRACQSLFELSVRVSGETEEAVAELLANIFNVPASVYLNIQTGVTCASVYVSQVAASQRTQVEAGLRTLRQSGLALGSGRISVRRLPRENWAESWKRHFKPLEISAKLLVVPSWSRRRPRPSQAVVILDPGLSFGTGHHPTTAFCLQQIARLRNPAMRQSFLDIGSGSGILSIAAAQLGYAPVVAFDFDPDAVRVARENAALNGVCLEISQRDLTKLPRRSKERFSVVCANLTDDLLIEERQRILNRLAPDGTLVLAGILTEQFTKVQHAFEAAGLRLVASRVAKGWRSGAFRWH